MVLHQLFHLSTSNFAIVKEAPLWYAEIEKNNIVKKAN